MEIHIVPGSGLHFSGAGWLAGHLVLVQVHQVLLLVRVTQVARPVGFCVHLLRREIGRGTEEGGRG